MPQQSDLQKQEAQQEQQEPSVMDGENRSPRNKQQERENEANKRVLSFAYKRYSTEARIVELVDRTRARPIGAEPHQPEATLWHALIVLEDSRHAVVGARYDERRDEWEAFEVSPPVLSDPA